MTVPFLDLSMQYKLIQQDIDAAILEVFKNSRFILGQKLETFEQEFAKYCGVEYAIGVNSGTDAIALTLTALGVNEGDEILTVPNTAIPTVSAIRMAHAKPVFVDIDENTQLMNPALLEQKVTERTAGILPVHLFGQCCDMDAILEFAKRKKLFVLEDACQAHGAEYNGKKAGAMGIAGCFSFYPSKNLGAYGDGGMITTNDKEFAEKLRMMRNYGQPQRYECTIEGINSRLDEMHASILSVKLKHLDEWNNKRKEHAKTYRESIKTDKIILPTESYGRKHNYHLFVIRIKERDKLKKFLSEQGIGTEIHYPIPLYLQKGYTFLGIKEGACPVAEKTMKEILSLPIYPELEYEDILFVANAINSFD